MTLRVCESDGPCGGDLTILKRLLDHEIVYKRVEVTTMSNGFPEFPSARQHFIPPPPTRYKESGMINLLRMTAKMTVDNHGSDEIPRENNARRMPVNNYNSIAQDCNDTNRFLLPN